MQYPTEHKRIYVALIALVFSACGSTKPDDGMVIGVAIIEGVWPLENNSMYISEVDALYISIDEELDPTQATHPFPALARIDSLYWPASDSLLSLHAQNGDSTAITFSFRLPPGKYQFHWGANGTQPDQYAPRMTAYRTVKSNQTLTERWWLGFMDIPVIQPY